jgi:hypothetical protein
VTVKSPTDAHAIVDATVRGQAGMQFRELFSNQSMAKKTMEMLAQHLFAGATLLNYSTAHQDDIWQPVGLHLDLDASGSISAEDKTWRLAVPLENTLAKTVSIERRETPIWFGPPQDATVDVEFELPAGYQSVHTPADFTLEHSCFHAHRSSVASERKISMHFEFSLLCREVSPSDYAAYRAAALKLVRLLKEDVVFAEASAPEASSPKRTPAARRD